MEDSLTNPTTCLTPLPHIHKKPAKKRAGIFPSNPEARTTRNHPRAFSSALSAISAVKIQD
jgi:hypothetical protein